jgi:hypothetical protein
MHQPSISSTGISAGFQGVRAGAEVTMHFMPFPDAQVEACYCGSENCRGTQDRRMQESANIDSERIQGLDVMLC